MVDYAAGILERCEIIPYVDDTQWHATRLTGIGGSDVATILGINPYDSRYSLWLQKTTGVSTFDGNEATDWGHILEPVIAARYAEQYNKAVVAWNVTLRSKRRPWALANMDFLIVEPSDHFPAGVVTEWTVTSGPQTRQPCTTPPPNILSILEIKTTGIATPGMAHKWKGDDSPVGYQAQVMHYGMVSGIRDFVLVCLVAGEGLQVRDIPWDLETAKNIAAAEDQFWHEHVIPQVEPEADGSDASEEALKLKHPRSAKGKVYEGGDELAYLWDQFENAKAVAAETDLERKRLRNELARIMGDAEEGMANGVTLFTYRNNKDGRKFNEKAYKEAHPDEWEEFAFDSPGARVMRGKT